MGRICCLKNYKVINIEKYILQQRNSINFLIKKNLHFIIFLLQLQYVHYKLLYNLI